MITTQSKRANRIAVLALVALAVTGCASGGAKFTCPYSDRGIGCNSTPAVYEMTDSLRSPEFAGVDTPAYANTRPRTRARTKTQQPPANTHAASLSGDSLSLAAPVQDGMGAFHSTALSLGGYRAPSMPVEANAIARMPAQVMRIWVAPWIDEAGDLHRPGHIYTEIVSRRWAVGGDIREPEGHISFDPNGPMYPTN